MCKLLLFICVGLQMEQQQYNYVEVCTIAQCRLHKIVCNIATQFLHYLYNSYILFLLNVQVAVMY